MPVRGIVLFAALAASIPICFFQPFYGILAWTVISFVNPQSTLSYWPVAQSFPWAVAIAIPTLAGLVVFERRWERMVSRETILIAALWVWFTITSVVCTHNPLFADHAEDAWYRWRFVSKILLMTVVTMAIVRTPARLRMLVLVIAGCFGIFVVKTFPFILSTGGQFRVYGPDNSMIADNNDFGLALNMTLPLYFFLAQTESKRWLKRSLGILFLITIPAIFFTYSRGALLGLCAVLAVMFWRSKKRFVLIPVAVFAMFFAMLFAPESWKNRMDPTSPNAMDTSARARINAWHFAWNLASDFPITGGGFATFTPSLFARYAPNGADIHGPHSVYFQILGEHGFVGLALYLALLLSCFMSLRTVAKTARVYDDGVSIQYANMLALSIVGFIVSGTFLGRAYFDYFFTLVACVVVLKRTAAEQWANLEPAHSADEQDAPAMEGQWAHPL